MQITFDQSRWIPCQKYMRTPETKATLIAAAILGGSLFTGIWVLPVSKFWGEVVLVTGASIGWGIFFNSR